MREDSFKGAGQSFQKANLCRQSDGQSIFNFTHTHTHTPYTIIKERRTNGAKLPILCYNLKITQTATLIIPLDLHLKHKVKHTHMICMLSYL